MTYALELFGGFLLFWAAQLGLGIAVGKFIKAGRRYDD